MLDSSPTKKITIRFSANMREAMRQHMLDAGYHLHGKSQWLVDSVKDFVTLPNYTELVEHGVSVNQGELCHVEAFYLSNDVEQLLQKAILAVRIENPLLEGVRSAIVRASVVHRLMSEEQRFSPGEKTI